MSMLCGLSLAVVAGVGILDGGLSLRCWVPTATAGLFLSGLPWLLVFDGRLWAATGILLELTTALIVILFFSQPKTTYSAEEKQFLRVCDLYCFNPAF